MALSHRIYRDEIDTGQLAAHQGNKFSCLFFPVIDMINQDVFVRHTAFGHVSIMTRSLDDFFHGVFAADGHELCAQFLMGRVQGYR